MAKPRKMLGSAESPYIIRLMRLIETQSKETIQNFSIAYAEEHWLPIYAKAYPEDERISQVLTAIHAYLKGELKLADTKKELKKLSESAKAAEKNPAAQAAVKAADQAFATIHRSTGALSMAFYGAAAVAYDRVGLEESPELYDHIAEEVCTEMAEAFQKVSVENEPNPAKINWYC